MSEQLTVTDYIVRRLASEGIADCFGAEGDFALNGGLLDAALARAATLEPACCIEVVAARLMEIVHPSALN
jgi:TPP-dependent 2-oxoacid decarboxylase